MILVRCYSFATSTVENSLTTAKRQVRHCQRQNLFHIWKFTNLLNEFLPFKNNLFLNQCKVGEILYKEKNFL